MKDFFIDILDIFKKPTTKIIELAQKDTIKAVVIKGVIISILVPLITLLGTVIKINKIYKFKASYYTSSYYTESYIQSMKEENRTEKLEALKDAKLAATYFKGLLISVSTMAILALVLYIIAKLLKSPKKYLETLSMIINVEVIITIGLILGTILGFIYKPLEIILLIATYVFAVLTLILGFRDSLTIESSDKLILFTTLISIAVFIVTIIIICAINGIPLKSIDSMLDFTSSISSYSSLFK